MVRVRCGRECEEAADQRNCRAAKVLAAAKRMIAAGGFSANLRVWQATNRLNLIV
jgi:hypothetical protein